jgi:TolA-binding protein
MFLYQSRTSIGGTMNRFATLRSLFLSLTLLFFSFVYVGCGGSGEAMSEDEMVTNTGAAEDTTAEEHPTVEEQQPQPAEQQPAPVEQPAEGPTREQLQMELDELKTENIQLKDQLADAQEKNQKLSAKVSDLEAANMALKKSESTPKRVSSQPAIAGKSSPEHVRAYDAAVSKFNSKNYTGAISDLQSLLDSGIKDDYADNCHYWMGLAYFQMKEYTTAIEHLTQVMSYRFSEKKDDAQLIIAQSYERMGNRERAMAEYKKLVDMYPTSEYVGRARAKLH